MKLGLKLWSINKNFVESAVGLYQQGCFNYIELFIVPGSKSYLEMWNDMKIPFVLHAPHSLAGFNPSIKEREIANFNLLPELDEFRNALNPSAIIFHPGADGDLDETIRQFSKIREKFPAIHELALVENKPAIGLNSTCCIGSRPDEITRIMEEADMGFCFDLGHAICAANTIGIDPFILLGDFLRLQPAMFHVSDGDGKSEMDSHFNLGFGNYDLMAIFRLLPENAQITIETDKSSENNLNDFARDVEYLSYLSDSLKTD